MKQLEIIGWDKERSSSEKYNIVMFIIINLKEILNSQPQKYSQEKIDEFNNIEKFISTLSIEEIELVYNKLLILATTDQELIDEFERRGQGNQISEGQFITLLMPLGVIYLISLRENSNAFNIDDSLLYYSINAMRCTPISKYKEAIDKVTYSKLTSILTNNNIPYHLGKDNNEIRLILNRLVDNAEKSKEEYDESKLNEEMNNFISDYVYKKIVDIIDPNVINIDNLIDASDKTK